MQIPLVRMESDPNSNKFGQRCERNRLDKRNSIIGLVYIRQLISNSAKRRRGLPIRKFLISPDDGSIPNCGQADLGHHSPKIGAAVEDEEF